jgi:Undecaprenyl-phosphate glucose phosphotransferase
MADGAEPQLGHETKGADVKTILPSNVPGVTERYLWRTMEWPMTESVASQSFVESIDLRRSGDADPGRATSEPVSERIVTSLVAVGDGIAVIGTGAAAMISNMDQISGEERNFATLAVLFAVVLFVNVTRMMDGYRFATLRQPRSAMGTAVLAWLSTAIVVAAALRLADDGSVSAWLWSVRWLFASLGTIFIIRAMVNHLCERWAKAGRLTRRAAVVGAGPVGRRVVSTLAETPDGSISVLGFYEDRRGRTQDGNVDVTSRGAEILGSVDDLVSDIRRRRVDLVIVTLPLSADRRLDQILRKLEQTPATIMLCPEWFDLRAGTCPMQPLGGLPLLRATDRPLRDWRAVAKSVEDRILAAVILMMILPLLAIIATVIKIDSPGPVLFRQKRYGFNNEIIDVFKFRSMYHHSRDPNAEQLTRRGDPRITRVGSFLRRTSLDELPQFFNVLRGEMSIVGPRPHALAAKAGGCLYPDAVQFYHARHRVKPGITGWAQVNGWRGETETVDQIVKRVEHDLYYVEHWSVLLDLQIILRTMMGGFTGRQVY